jgi:hypothetical protein
MRKGSHQTPEAIEKNRIKHLGKKDSQTTKDKKRISHEGENNAFFGKHHTEETLELLRKPKSETAKKNMSKSRKGKIPANIEILKHSREGKTNSDFQKQRAKESITGLKRSDKTIELNRIGHIGLTQSDEAREKNRLAHMGDKNSSWKGGLKSLNESIRGCAKYAEWRDAIYERDNYTDVITGEKGNGNLNAHHITPLAELIEKHHITTLEEAISCNELWDISNGITMLESNHILYHARTGRPE